MSDDIEARAAEAVAHGLLKAALADDRTARLRVTTGSMQPAIRAGDEILLKACAWTDLRPGDVVVCERDGILQVHRFLRIKVVEGGPRLVTKGDAAWHFDSPLPVDRLIGRAERIERDGQGIDLMGGWPRARARWIAAASAMKAYGAQVFRQLKHRAALAVVLSLALSLHYLTSASAAVSVSSFDAQGGQGQITLNWITATELKNFGFNVERSVNSADPNAWTKIAFVQSQSPCIQSLEPLTYTYTDGGLPAGAKYYYRLQLFGSPCGDPNVYHDTIVSAVASGAVATATPTATAVPPTATPSPTATATPTPTVTPPATSTTSPSAPNATGVPATNTPASVPPGGPGATVSAPSAPVPSASARAAPAVTIAAAPSSGAAAGTPVPPDAPATVEPTTTVVAMAIATTAPNAPRTNPQAPRKPTPTEPAVAASPSPTLLGVGLLAVLGMGMAGFGLLAVAGFVLWQYYLHR